MPATSVGEAKYGTHFLTNIYDYLPLLPIDPSHVGNLFIFFDIGRPRSIDPMSTPDEQRYLAMITTTNLSPCLTDGWINGCDIRENA